MAALFDAYLAGAARAFFGSHPWDTDDRLRAVRRAARPLAPGVAETLAAQNSRYVPSPARDEHLTRLRRGAAAVVTGQQVGLFLGPLFTLYKAATAVRVARALASESNEAVVPVFWLQTEDHDLPEIAVTRVPRARGAPLELSLPSSSAGRIPVAQLTLPEEVSARLAELRAELGSLPFAHEHLSRLERHYRPGAGWAAAFAGFLAELFAPEGLVLIDPRDPAIAAAAAPVHRRAILDADAIAAALAERTRTIEAAGFVAAVHVRDGSPLSFFHPDGPTGPRHRLDPDGEGSYAAGGGGSGPRHTREDLLAALAADPLVFSTSALLRPIVQDSLLPTAAYVGGPGEVAYFAQLPPLYEAFGLTMPLIVPRARFRVIEPAIGRLLTKLKLEPDDARLGEDALLARCRPDDRSLPAGADVARALLTPFDAAVESLAPALHAAGPDLVRSARRTRGGVEKAVRRLAARYEKARLHRDDALVADVRRLQHHLAPGGVPQERVYGLSYFAARHGERAFVESVLDAILPFDPTPRNLSMDSSSAAPSGGGDDHGRGPDA